MIFAELVTEDQGANHFALRYMVWNGENLIGAYNVLYKPLGKQHVPYGASRDYHRLATDEEIASGAKWDAFQALPEDEQNAAYNAHTEPDFPSMVQSCCFFDGKPTVCDGSSLVEIVTNNDKRCFEIAANMAEIERVTA